MTKPYPPNFLRDEAMQRGLAHVHTMRLKFGITANLQVIAHHGGVLAWGVPQNDDEREKSRRLILRMGLQLLELDFIDPPDGWRPRHTIRSVYQYDIDTRGKPVAILEQDGWYVAGGGMLIPCMSEDEALDLAITIRSQ